MNQTLLAIATRARDGYVFPGIAHTGNTDLPALSAGAAPGLAAPPLEGLAFGRAVECALAWTKERLAVARAVLSVDADNARLVQLLNPLMEHRTQQLAVNVVLRLRPPTELVDRLLEVAEGPTAGEHRWFNPYIASDLRLLYRWELGPDPEAVKAMIREYYANVATTVTLLEELALAARGPGKGLLTVFTTSEFGSSSPFLSIGGQNRAGAAFLTVQGAFLPGRTDLQSLATVSTSKPKHDEIVGGLAVRPATLALTLAGLEADRQAALRQIEARTGGSTGPSFPANSA